MSQDPLHLVCLGLHFPSRLGLVADWLVRYRGYRCHFFAASADPMEQWPASAGKGLTVLRFPVAGLVGERITWLRQLERGLWHALGCLEALEAARPRPVDVVLAHSAGFGLTLYVPDTLLTVPVVNLFEYFVRAHEHDIANHPDPPSPIEYQLWRRAANALDLLELENGTRPWTQTCWQRDTFPAEYRADFTVLHDGVDTRRFARRAKGERRIAGHAIPEGTRVVSFVARSLDRVRGFDRFMAIANRIARAHSNVLFVVVGAPMVQRELDVPLFGQDYRAQVLARHPPPEPGRIWFLDTVQPDIVAQVLGVTDLHLYPSRPYPVARSLIEAMAAGAVILACDAEPV